MNLKRLMALGSVNTSPDKTKVSITNNSVSIKNIGCKGVLKKRAQCDYCERKGTYQAGILAWLPCCNRDDGWRRLEGRTERNCKYYVKKVKEK